MRKGTQCALRIVESVARSVGLVLSRFPCYWTYSIAFLMASDFLTSGLLDLFEVAFLKLIEAPQLRGMNIR